MIRLTTIQSLRWWIIILVATLSLGLLENAEADSRGEGEAIAVFSLANLYGHVMDRLDWLPPTTVNTYVSSDGTARYVCNGGSHLGAHLDVIQPLFRVNKNVDVVMRFYHISCLEEYKDKAQLNTLNVGITITHDWF